MFSFLDNLNSLLLRPGRILFICLLLGGFAVTFDGSMLQYLSLQRTERELEERIAQVTKASGHLRSQIEQTKNLGFLEKQAREKLDVVGDDELVFIFSDEP